jgi:predicted nucleic acid-binding protein
VSRVTVCDASALVAMLLDAGADGEWVTAMLEQSNLAAPALISFEAANIIRRHRLAALIPQDQALQAHADLLELAIELWPYAVLAERTWELRHNLSIYDASYVALAETLAAPLVTLDAKLAAATGPHCEIKLPYRT